MDQADQARIAAATAYAGSKLFVLNTKGWGPMFPILKVERRVLVPATDVDAPTIELPPMGNPRMRRALLHQHDVSEADYLEEADVLTLQYNPGETKIIKKHVPHDQWATFQRVSPKASEVDTYAYSTFMKVRNNMAFLNLLGSKQLDADSQFVVLDSPSLLTSSFLYTRGVSKDSIHVPNPFEEFKLKSKWSTVYPVPLYQFLVQTEKSFDGAALDYCCTFEGNQTDTKPIEDLRILFGRRLLKDRSPLWLTFSLRRGPQSSGQSFDGTDEHIQKTVNELARRYGYMLDLVEHERYRGGSKKGTGGHMVRLLYLAVHTSSFEQSKQQSSKKRSRDEMEENHEDEKPDEEAETDEEPNEPEAETDEEKKNETYEEPKEDEDGHEEDGHEEDEEGPPTKKQRLISNHWECLFLKLDLKHYWEPDDGDVYVEIVRFLSITFNVSEQAASSWWRANRKPWNNVCWKHVFEGFPTLQAIGSVNLKDIMIRFEKVKPCQFL